MELVLRHITGYLWDRPLLLFEAMSGLLPLIFSIWRLEYLKNDFKYLLYYSVLIFGLELIGLVTAAHSIQNHMLYLVFFLLEVLVIAIFSFNINKMYHLKNVYICVTAIAVLPLLANIALFPKRMDNNLLTVVSLVPIAFSLLTYYAVLKELKIQSLKESVIFWFSTANLIYFSGRFFVFLFIYQVLDPNDISLKNLWEIVSALLIIQRLMLCKAIWQTSSTYSN